MDPSSDERTPVVPSPPRARARRGRSTRCATSRRRVGYGRCGTGWATGGSASPARPAVRRDRRGLRHGGLEACTPRRATASCSRRPRGGGLLARALLRGRGERALPRHRALAVGPHSGRAAVERRVLLGRSPGSSCTSWRSRSGSASRSPPWWRCGSPCSSSASWGSSPRSVPGRGGRLVGRRSSPRRSAAWSSRSSTCCTDGAHGVVPTSARRTPPCRRHARAPRLAP